MSLSSSLSKGVQESGTRFRTLRCASRCEGVEAGSGKGLGSFWFKARGQHLAFWNLGFRVLGLEFWA